MKLLCMDAIVGVGFPSEVTAERYVKLKLATRIDGVVRWDCDELLSMPEEAIQLLYEDLRAERSELHIINTPEPTSLILTH
jgi:hypothetical protein